MKNSCFDLLFLCSLLFLGGCKGRIQSTPHETSKFDTTRTEHNMKEKHATSLTVKSLKALWGLPRGTMIDTLDLSHQQLTEVPALYHYKIKVLNLSHNKLKGNFMDGNLPMDSLELLDVSYNHLKELTVGSTFLRLKKMLCHHNDLSYLRISSATTYVVASHNQLTSFEISTKKENELSRSDYSLSYLDLSYNPHQLYVRFDPKDIDTLILKGTPPVEQIELYF